MKANFVVGSLWTTCNDYTLDQIIENSSSKVGLRS